MTRSDTRRFPLALATLMAAALGLALSGCHWAGQAERAARPIVEKNAEARGGLAAWRAIRSLSMSGQLEAGRPRDQAKLARSLQRPTRERKAEARRVLAHGRPAEEAPPVLLPFTLELERPMRSRLEIRFQGQTAVQVYDGDKGWKLRPFLGRNEVEPFSPDELHVAAEQADLDGPLIDADAKGSRVELEGTEPVEGRDAYRLKVTLRSGLVRRVWVDTQTYLDVRVDGTRKLDGVAHPVWTSLRDYRTVGGVKVPYLLETAVEGVPGSEKIQVEKVALNPKIDAARFTAPAPSHS